MIVLLPSTEGTFLRNQGTKEAQSRTCKALSEAGFLLRTKDLPLIGIYVLVGIITTIKSEFRVVMETPGGTIRILLEGIV